jgi:hypothetical protein
MSLLKKNVKKQKMLDITNHKVVAKNLLVDAGVSPIRFGVQPEFPDNPNFQGTA